MITAWVGNERMHLPADASSFGSGIFPANVWGAKHNSPIDRLSALITRKRKAQRTSIQPVPTLKFATPFTRNRKGGENLQRNNRNSATQANTAGDAMFMHSGAPSGVVAEGERIAVTDITERVKKKMAARGGTHYLRILGLTKSERIRVTRSKKKINGVGQFRGDRCTQVHKMLLREAAQQTVQLHKNKRGAYDWKHIKHDIKSGLLRVMKEDMSKRLATWDGEQKSKRRKQAEGGTKRSRSEDTDAVAVYGDCKKRNTDTDAEEALHRRIDEYEID